MLTVLKPVSGEWLMRRLINFYQSCKIAACVFSALLSCFTTEAQTEKYFTLKKYTQNEGLSSYNITKIIQDHRGYMWIGTQDGLNRFDGREFLIFKDEPGARHRLFGNNVSDIIEDTTRNIIWVSTSYGGITGIDVNTGNTLIHLITDENGRPLSERWVRTLAIRHNMLWIGTSQGLLAYELDKKIYYKIKSNVANLAGSGAGSIDKLFVDPDQNLWVGAANTGLALILKGSENPAFLLSPSELDLPAQNQKIYFWNIIHSGHNKILIATNLGARSVVYNEHRTPVINKMSSLLQDKEMLSCAIDENSILWFSDISGLYQFNLNNEVLSKIKDDDFSLTNWQSSIYQIYPDGNHNIWFGGQEGLALHHNQRSPFAAYCRSSVSDIKIQHAFSLLPLSDTVILCGAQDGVYRINTYNRSVSKIDGDGPCYLIYRHSDNNIIISTANGLKVLRENQLLPAAKIYPALSRIQNEPLNCALRWNDSLVILGTQEQKGLYIWNTVSKQLANYNNNEGRLGLSNNFCNSIYRDQKNKLWVLSQSHLCQFDPISKKSTTYKIRDPQGDRDCPILFDMCQSGSHYYFAAYGIGVIETDSALHTTRVISTRDHLANNGVYKVICYQDSLLFITSNNGLSTFNLRTAAIRNYFQSDGLHSSAFEEFCAVKVNEKIYAGGVNGFTVIEPQWLRLNTMAPRLYINSARLERESGQAQLYDAGVKRMDVASDVLQTTLSFSGINYSNAERTSFAYNLNGRQNDWIELGNQNFLDLVGNNPGKYKLQLRAANEDGIWCEPIGMDIIFLPKWYQSWWFRFVLAATFLLAIYWLYRLRVNRLKSEQAIRTRLAIDLHDDLGSTLNSVKMYANLGLLEKEKDTYLQHIKQNTQEGIQSIRDIIWVMNEKAGTIENLVTRLSQFAAPFCEANGIRLVIEMANESYHYNLGHEEKQHIYLIFKEAINNSIKYARAQEIVLAVFFQKDKPVFVLKDDGTGFDINENMEGNGLNNIKERAKRINYLVQISPGEGTTIQLQKI